MDFAAIRDVSELADTLSVFPANPSRLNVVNVSGPIDQPELKPLLIEDPEFTDRWIVDFHREQHDIKSGPLSCYLGRSVTVSGIGNIWIDGQLVGGNAVLHPLVTYSMTSNGPFDLDVECRRPIRKIARPCIVVGCYGIQIYGHFLMEILPRLLIAKRVCDGLGIKAKLLMDGSLPYWLRKILIEDLEIAPEDFEFYDPSSEQILLDYAIIPSLSVDSWYHPHIRSMFANLAARLTLPSPQPMLPRLFVTRAFFYNPSSPKRVCLNEHELLKHAVSKFNFTPVAPESLSWRAQIRIFAEAEMVIGPFGSGMHNTMFCSPGCTVASLGVGNMAQTFIATVMGHRVAYLRTGSPEFESFSIELDIFDAFLSKLLNA